MSSGQLKNVPFLNRNPEFEYRFSLHSISQ